MKKALAVTVFLFATSAFAYNCNAVVDDNANVLGGKIDQIQAAASQLVTKGADPHIVTDDVSVMPEQYVEHYKNICKNWQSAGGGVKNNLIVFLVFPKHHKLGLFLGNEFGHAINTSLVRTQFMAPGFKDGDYVRGFISGIDQVGVEIEAFQTGALHPSTTVVTQQPTDYSGLWKWLDALLILAAVGGLIGLLFYLRNRRREAKDAQQRAVEARNEAAIKVTANPNSQGAETFARFSGSETYNPDTNRLSRAQYDSIAEAYRRVSASMEPPVKKKVNPYRRERYDNNQSNVSAGNTSRPSPAPVQSTTIINENPGYMPIPIIVDEPVYIPERAPDPPQSGWRDDSSGFSDSSSSSSYDSGGSFSDSSSSSDFGSSGGDFSGGSSDF